MCQGLGQSLEAIPFLLGLSGEGMLGLDFHLLGACPKLLPTCWAGPKLACRICRGGPPAHLNQRTERGRGDAWNKRGQDL